MTLLANLLRYGYAAAPAPTPVDRAPVSVIGGGALGCSAALALADRGHAVTLLERGSLGSGSTGKAAGILSTLCHSDAEYKLIAQTRGLVGETMSLALAAGCREAKGAWRSHPSIVVGKGDSLRTLDAMQERVERFTEECERLDARQATRQFPSIRFEPGEEVLVAQEDGVIEAGDLLAALRARMESEGVTVREGTAVTKLPKGLVVVAGGPWTMAILAADGVRLPMRLDRMQLARLQMPGGGDLPIVQDLVHGLSTRPQADDQVVARGSLQPGDFAPDDVDDHAEPGFLATLADKSASRFEEGSEARIATGEAGLCVVTPDRQPLCGPVAGRDDLFVLTGDNGIGLMTGLALGQRLADAVGGRVHADLDPRRFAV